MPKSLLPTPTPKPCALATSLQSPHLVSLGPCAESRPGSGLYGCADRHPLPVSVPVGRSHRATVSTEGENVPLKVSAESWALKGRMKRVVSVTIFNITGFPITVQLRGQASTSALAYRHLSVPGPLSDQLNQELQDPPVIHVQALRCAQEEGVLGCRGVRIHRLLYGATSRPLRKRLRGAVKVARLFGGLRILSTNSSANFEQVPRPV